MGHLYEFCVQNTPMLLNYFNLGPLAVAPKYQILVIYALAYVLQTLQDIV